MAKVFVKIGADDTALEKALKNTSNKLQAFGKSMEKVGMKLTQGLTVPIAGAAAAVFAFSEKSKAAFEKLGTSVKSSLGRIGDDIAKSINLGWITEGIAGMVRTVSEAFVSLPTGLKAAAVAIAALAASIGPLLLIIGKMATGWGALIGLLSGPIGFAVAVGIAIAALVAAAAAMGMVGSATESAAGKISRATKELLSDSEARLKKLQDSAATYQRFLQRGYSLPEAGKFDAKERAYWEDKLRATNEQIEAYSKEVSVLRERDIVEEATSKTLAKHADILADFTANMTAYGETMDNLSAKLHGLKNIYVEWLKVGLKPADEFMKNLRDDIEATTDALEKQTDATKRLGVYQTAATAGRTYAIQGGGVNPIAASRDAMMGRYNQMASDNLKLGIEAPNAEMIRLRESIEALQDPWSEFVGLVAASAPVWQQLGQAMHSVVQAFTAGVGDAIAQVLVYGQSLGKMMQDLMKRIAAMIISTLVQIAIQWVISSLLGVGMIVTQTVAAVKAYAIQTWAGAFAATAAIPIVGPAAAAGVAGAALATMLAGVPAAGAAGMGVGAASMATAAEGGIFTTPGITAIAERGRPELVLNEQNIRRFFPGMLGGGRPVVVHSHVILDGREIGKASVKYIPDVIRGL